MKLYLVRHGETQSGTNGKYGYSARLTELGREQASRTGELLSGMGVTGIVSSHATRALETAEPLSRVLGIDPTVIPELIEIDIGRSSDGVTPFEDLDAEQFVMDCSHMGGENWDVFRDRVMIGLDRLATSFEHDSVVAVFTHGGVKSVALDHYSGRDISIKMVTEYANCSVSTVEQNGSGYIVKVENEISHLG